MKWWRPQFSIQSLMLLMVIAGLSVGWFVDHSVHSRDRRLQASELRRVEGQLGRLTNVFERFQEVLSDDGIEFDYDLDHIRFLLEAPYENSDTKRRIINVSG